MKSTLKLLSTLGILFFSSFSFSSEKILMVLTSHNTLGDTGKKTGFWLSELTHPYYALSDAGYDIDLASIQGASAPIDPKSLDHSDKDNQRFFKDAKLMSQVLDTVKLSSLKASDYKAIVYAGGHGTMWDLPVSPAVNKITANIYEQGGVVAAVCHGPAALLNVTLSNGEQLIKGKRFAAFTNKEEKIASLDKFVPFLLQSRLIELGGKHVYAQPWTENVIIDQRLITGQNPQSAHKLGMSIVQELKRIKG